MIIPFFERKVYIAINARGKNSFRAIRMDENVREWLGISE
jgi:hypothetical protein